MVRLRLISSGDMMAMVSSVNVGGGSVPPQLMQGKFSLGHSHPQILQNGFLSLLPIVIKIPQKQRKVKIIGFNLQAKECERRRGGY